MQLIASWGVSCEVVSIFSNYIRNLFYIFLVGLEKHVSQPTSPIIILTIRSINEINLSIMLALPDEHDWKWHNDDDRKWSVGVIQTWLDSFSQQG